MKSRQWKKFYRVSRAKMESSLNEIVCPIDTEWKFKKGDLMDLKQNEYLTGKYFYAFNIPGIQYFIRIYPNGYNEKHRGQTWISLYLNGSEKRKANANVTISIKSANYSEKLYKVYDDDDHGYGEEVCKNAEFFEYKSKYFVNGEITIKVKGTVKAERSSISMISRPISMRWKIKEADLIEAMNDESKTYLYSKDVNIESFSGVTYNLSFCPNEINDEEIPTATLTLNTVMKEIQKIIAVYDYSIDTANFIMGFESVFEEPDNGWCISLCSTKDLFNASKGFLVDRYLTINLNGVLMTENNRYITLNCNNEVTPKPAMKNDEKDFFIVAEGEDIKIHRKVLSDASPVFARMKEPIFNEMFIKDFDFETVDIVIKLCYSNSTLLKYSLETLLSIYRFGDKYRIEFITDLIEDFLIKEISQMNVVYILKFSAPDSFNVKKLYQSCIEFLIKCSKNSTPIYASESLDEKFLASMVLNTFSSLS